MMMMMMIAQSIDNSANTGMVTEDSLDNGLDRGNFICILLRTNTIVMSRNLIVSTHTHSVFLCLALMCVIRLLFIAA